MYEGLETAGFNVQLMNEVPHGSEAYRKKNPHLFPCGNLARLPDTERQHIPLPALDEGKKVKRRGKGRVGKICIKIISFRSRYVDPDNIISGAKPLRDAIARSIQLDDGDERIWWEYDAICTQGATGTQVLISRI